MTRSINFHMLINEIHLEPWKVMRKPRLKSGNENITTGMTKKNEEKNNPKILYTLMDPCTL